VPLIVGYVVVLGHRENLYDTELATALFAVLLIVVFTATIWRTAITLDHTNRAREAAQRERDDLLVRERAARKEAERLGRSKDEFLATLSHELRTPLNTLLGWTDMLHFDAVADERRLHAAEVIARNGNLLARLVEDLLDVSRIATGHLRLNVKPVDLGRLATAAVEAIAADARAKGVRLVSCRADVAAIVNGDEERLQQIIDNLLSNAVKFTPSGGVVDVAIQILPSTVTLTVRDTGQGIDAEFLPHVFDRFRQGDDTTTRVHGGLGLGLSIVRELTQLHGGSVEAFSAGPGLGATFAVTFPLSHEHRPAVDRSGA